MKSTFAFWGVAFCAASLFLTGCDRKNAAKKEEGTLIQPGGINEESDQWGYMALRILKVHEKQKALDAVPWFADGGDRTFLECVIEKDPSVRVLIGNAIHAVPNGDAASYLICKVFCRIFASSGDERLKSSYAVRAIWLPKGYQ